jgi:hypothetical protein
MKKIVLAILVFSSLIANSQNEMKSFRFYVSPSIHIGFFSPDEINEYIENATSSLSLTSGNKEMMINFNGSLGFGFRFFNLAELQTVTEYSIAPKSFLVSNGENMSFTFSKFTAGLMANIMIPLTTNERKTSAIIGGGILYHNMSFEEYQATKVAPRIQAGLSLNNNKFNPQILISYDMAKADDNGFELDYSGVRIGVHLNF